jgi:hypothetical protein
VRDRHSVILPVEDGGREPPSPSALSGKIPEPGHGSGNQEALALTSAIDAGSPRTPRSHGSARSGPRRAPFVLLRRRCVHKVRSQVMKRRAGVRHASVQVSGSGLAIARVVMTT